MKKIKKPLFKNLIQVGMVTRDLQRSMYSYVFDYGIGPMYVLEFNSGNVSDMYLYGKRKDYAMNLGVCPIGDVRFELIEPITDSIYSDYLNQYGDGIIHHLKLAVDDYHQALKYLQSLGIKIIQSGHQLGGSGKNMYTYLDTAHSLGFIIEVVNVEKDFVKPPPQRWYPQNKEAMPQPLFVRPNQFGIIVKDLDEKIGQYRTLFGFEDWTVKEFDSSNVTEMHISGKKKDYSARAGFYKLGNVQLKLIQPTSESIFSEFYEKYGKGVIHHLGMEIAGYDKTLKLLESKDVRIIQSGCYKDKIRYSYFATGKDLNFIVEIVEKNSTVNLL